MKSDKNRNGSTNRRSVTVIGGGQMGRALVGGMIVSGFASADQFTVVEISDESRDWWSENHPAVAVREWIEQPEATADVVLLAVKPYHIEEVISELVEFSESPQLILSIAAGVSLKTLCECVGHQRVARVMPNTPCLVGAGASAYCTAPGTTGEDAQWIDQALSGVGVVTRVAESQMNAVTGLSGSGPAYICLVIEALADGGVLSGLDRSLAMQLATQTVMGTAKLMMETGRHPGELKDAVASPGGTTIAALKVLEERGLRAALINAVQASANRSAELG